MASILRFDNWESTDGTEIANTNGSDISFNGTVSGNIAGTIKNDFASFGSTVAVTVSNNTPVKRTFDTALYASTDMSWAYGSATVDVPDTYSWKHSQTGYYKLTNWLRTTSDVWNVMSVCRNDDYTDAVGTSARTGSAAAWGWGAEAIYKVTDINDTFCIYHWSYGASGAQSAFTGTPPTGFVAPAQDGTTPANGYFHTFNIVKLSDL